MPLVRLPEPFDHPDWLFEIKYDGFRALAHITGHQCELRSRNAVHSTTGRSSVICEHCVRVWSVGKPGELFGT
jgi:ATP-dependent DNA ligase